MICCSFGVACHATRSARKLAQLARKTTHTMASTTSTRLFLHQQQDVLRELQVLRVVRKCPPTPMLRHAMGFWAKIASTHANCEHCSS